VFRGASSLRLTVLISTTFSQLATVVRPLMEATDDGRITRSWHLLCQPLPLDWEQQRQLLGFE